MANPVTARRYLPSRASIIPLNSSFWEITVAAAIIASDLARQEFKSRGIGPQIFTCPSLHDAVRAAMAAPDDFERVALQAIGDPDVLGQVLLRIEILQASPDGAVDRHAISDVCRGAAALATSWMPSLLESAANLLRKGAPLFTVEKRILMWMGLAQYDPSVPDSPKGASPHG
ncbi:MAG: hypothetical protein JSR77_15095 [Planctomycetes bacterium]|nr:hypothetical protein [Planctomycetota bacterium]